MKYRSIQWDFIKSLYEDNQILAINFQIIDMDFEDLKNKGYEAAQILKKLIEKMNVISYISILFKKTSFRKFTYTVRLE